MHVFMQLVFQSSLNLVYVLEMRLQIATIVTQITTIYDEDVFIQSVLIPPCDISISPLPLGLLIEGHPHANTLLTPKRKLNYNSETFLTFFFVFHCLT